MAQSIRVALQLRAPLSLGKKAHPDGSVDARGSGDYIIHMSLGFLWSLRPIKILRVKGTCKLVGTKRDFQGN